MNNETILGSIDPQELEKLASRREAVERAGKFGVGLALASVPLALAGLVKQAFAQSQGNFPPISGTVSPEIVAALNFALILEELEREFYFIGAGLQMPSQANVQRIANLIPNEDREIFETLRQHEDIHVRFLRGALGNAAVAKPTFDFTGGNGTGTGPFADVFTNYATFRALAQAFEDTGVRAYKGQAPVVFPNKSVLEAALKIHSVEARHASEVRRLNGNFSEQAPQKGWITGNQRGPLLPALAQPIYDGEENVQQGAPPAPAPGINVATLNLAPTGVPAATNPAVAQATAASEAFDEPLTRAQVIAIVDPFVVEMIS